jgi:thiol-disulfide isomerase/thioredoxin
VSGGVWIASYVLLWVLVLVLAAAVVALLRQIGVLHTRISPMGVHFAGEGPEKDAPAPDATVHDYAASQLTLVAFTSPTCELCARLEPALARLAAGYREVRVRTIRSDEEPSLFGAFAVRSTPYVVAVDREGIVRSRGVANTLDQVEEMLAEVLARQEEVEP